MFKGRLFCSGHVRDVLTLDLQKFKQQILDEVALEDKKPPVKYVTPTILSSCNSRVRFWSMHALRHHSIKVLPRIASLSAGHCI